MRHSTFANLNEEEVAYAASQELPELVTSAKPTMDNREYSASNPEASIQTHSNQIHFTQVPPSKEPPLDISKSAPRALVHKAYVDKLVETDSLAIHALIRALFNVSKDNTHYVYTEFHKDFRDRFTQLSADIEVLQSHLSDLSKLVALISSSDNAEDFADRALEQSNLMYDLCRSIYTTRDSLVAISQRLNRLGTHLRHYHDGLMFTNAKKNKLFSYKHLHDALLEAEQDKAST